jgi:hypothetical protein
MKISSLVASPKTLMATLLGAAALAAALPAQAEILVTMSRPGNFAGIGAGGQLMPLTPAGINQTPAFFVPAGGRFIVSYTAECANDAPGTTSWVSLDIRAVNQATGAITILPPTRVAGDQDAFCSSNGTAGFDGWATHTVIATGVQLPAGNYRLQVFARTVNGGSGWLSDSSLVVWR